MIDMAKDVLNYRIFNMRLGGIIAFMFFWVDLVTDFIYIKTVRWQNKFLLNVSIIIYALPLVVITLICIYGIVTMNEKKVIEYFMDCCVRFTGCGDIFYSFNCSAKAFSTTEEV